MRSDGTVGSTRARSGGNINVHPYKSIGYSFLNLMISSLNTMHCRHGSRQGHEEAMRGLGGGPLSICISYIQT
jgi:hypothetical protein